VPKLSHDVLICLDRPPAHTALNHLVSQLDREWQVRQRHGDLDLMNHYPNGVIAVSPPTLGAPGRSNPCRRAACRATGFRRASAVGGRRSAVAVAVTVTVNRVSGYDCLPAIAGSGAGRRGVVRLAGISAGFPHAVVRAALAGHPGLGVPEDW